MGFLDDLKRQAEEAKARQTDDERVLQRNTALTEAACNSSSSYLIALAQQLNVLEPVSKATYRLDPRNVFTGLRLCDFRTDSRRRQLRGESVFDHIVLRFWMKSGQRVTMSRNFVPEIEKLEARLRQGGAKAESEWIKNPSNGKLQEVRYDIACDFQGSILVTPDHDRGIVRFETTNLDGFEIVTVEFPAFEVGSARLDELARWLVGESNQFLKDGQRLRIKE